MYTVNICIFLCADSKRPHDSPQKVYCQLINESTGGPKHAIKVPRDLNQVANFQKEVSRRVRISHDAMFNAYQLCFELFDNNHKGEKVEFIKFFVSKNNSPYDLSTYT